ncbi:alpha/beta hydrolase [Cronobacter turicensis]|uniref:alpha/beta hydrolase family protein n=1 Tax=Cronobacter turicensis TaxID=413502 RepID=UPI003570C864
MRNAIIITIGLLLALVMIIMWRLTVFEANSLPYSRVITFTHNEDILEGTLTLPAGVSSPPVVVLIHGDGAQDRWSQGGYLPLVNDLLAKGIAVYSWDKPGVGESRGNWLAQTMRDRSDEATVALKTLKKQPELLQSRFGFLGFSQAGWVVPQAAMLPESTPRCIRMIEGATHGLLKSRWYDYQLPSQWPAWTQGLFLLTGQHAYAPGALDAVSAWILHGECVSR